MNSLSEPNLSLHNTNQCFSFGQVSWDPNAKEMHRICLAYALFFFFLNLLTPSPLKWVYRREHLCYLLNTLAKNNPAHRIRLFLHLPAQHRHTCNLAEWSGASSKGLSWEAAEAKQWLGSAAWQTQLGTSGTEAWEVGVASRTNTAGKAGHEMHWQEQGRRRKAPSYLICVKTGRETPLRRDDLQSLPHRSKAYNTF